MSLSSDMTIHCHIHDKHYQWLGIKADVAAYVEQWHAWQVKRLELHYVAEIHTPHMSGSFCHVHIYMDWRYALCRVKAHPVNGRAGHIKATLSPERA